MPRLQKIDITRGIALIAMVIYHFTWNLGHFGIIAPETAVTGNWAIFARIIASTFLFLAGFSLYLSHKNGIRWKAFFKRFTIIAGAALLISIGTYFIIPTSYVYFGILHEIALTSLVGLLFLRTPILFNIIIIGLILLISVLMRFGVIGPEGALSFFQQPFFSFAGLNFTPKFAVDLVPFIPWFAAGLAGITVARIMAYFNVMSWLQKSIRPAWLSSTLQWLGHHTLIIYLLHQPILYGLVFLFVSSFPNIIRAPMEKDCVTSCSAQMSVEQCQKYCGCVFDGIENSRELNAYRQGKIGIDDSSLQRTIEQCQ